VRVVIVKNIPAPYTTELFGKLARHDGIDLTVVYEAVTEPGRHWRPSKSPGFREIFLPSSSLQLGRVAPDSHFHVSRGAREMFLLAKPQLVIASGGVWSSVVNIAAAARARRGHLALVPWWGEFRDAPFGSPRWLSLPLRRFVVGSGDAWLANTERAAANAVALGADPARVALAPYVPTASLGTARAAVRQHDGGGPTFLFVGQLTARKGIPELIAAADGLPGLRLRIAGAGPLLPEVSALAQRHAGVELLGQIDEARVEHEMSQADWLVVPSRFDEWGLVCHEAARVGLPMIASSNVGAIERMMVPGTSGLVFESGSTSALRVTLREAATWSDAQLEVAGEVAKRLAAGWDSRTAVDAIVQACELAWAAFSARRPPRRAYSGHNGRREAGET
jgi:glycosyltransferase involved in cell wall biosynthesis